MNTSTDNGGGDLGSTNSTTSTTTRTAVVEDKGCINQENNSISISSSISSSNPPRVTPWMNKRIVSELQMNDDDTELLVQEGSLWVRAIGNIVILRSALNTKHHAESRKNTFMEVAPLIVLKAQMFYYLYFERWQALSGKEKSSIHPYRVAEGAILLSAKMHDYPISLRLIALCGALFELSVLVESSQSNDLDAGICERSITSTVTDSKTNSNQITKPFTETTRRDDISTSGDTVMNTTVTQAPSNSGGDQTSRGGTEKRSSSAWRNTETYGFKREFHSCEGLGTNALNDRQNMIRLAERDMCSTLDFFSQPLPQLGLVYIDKVLEAVIPEEYRTSELCSCNLTTDGDVVHSSANSETVVAEPTTTTTTTTTTTATSATDGAACVNYNCLFKQLWGVVYEAYHTKDCCMAKSGYEVAFSALKYVFRCRGIQLPEGFYIPLEGDITKFGDNMDQRVTEEGDISQEQIETLYRAIYWQHQTD